MNNNDKPVLMMDQKLFEELLAQGRISEILMQGGINLTPNQLKAVKEQSKQESADEVERRKMAVAAKPGYREFMTMPLISKILASAGGQIPGQNASVNPEKQQSAVKEQPEQKTQKKDNKDPEFASIGPKGPQNLKVNDTEADVVVKIFNFLQRKQEFEKKKSQDLEKYHKEVSQIKEQRMEDVIAALLGEEPRKVGGVKKSIKAKPEKEKEKKSSGLLKMGALGLLGVGGVLATQKAFASIPKFELPKVGDVMKGVEKETPIEGTKTSQEPARKSAETYLGRALSDREWDLLLRATAAEASPDKEEQAVVAASILNRVRKSGTDVETELAKPYKFESYTGSKGTGYNPSKAFTAGPGARLPSILESMKELPRVSYQQTDFQSAIPEAYQSKEIGERKIAEKRKQGFVPVGKSIANVGIDRDISGRMTAMTDPRAASYQQEVVNASYIDKMNKTWKETLDILDGLEKLVSTTTVVQMTNNATKATTIAVQVPTINDTPALITNQYGK